MKPHTHLKSEEEREREQRDPSLDVPYVFKYVAGVGARLPAYGDLRLDGRDNQYAAVDDLDVAEHLMEKGAVAGGAAEYDTTRYAWLEPGDLESALNRNVDDITEAVEAGEYDAILDLLVFAEQEVYDGRKTVLDALTERSDAVAEAEEEEDVEDLLGVEDAGVDPSTIATR